MSRWSFADWVSRLVTSGQAAVGRARRRRARLLQRRAAERSRRTFLEPLESRNLLAAVITVNSTLDTDVRDAVLTLREAIEISNRTLSMANLSPQERQAVIGIPSDTDTDTIAFNILGGTGVQTIAPNAALPAITDPVTIDGYTQPGTLTNTNAIDDPDPAKRGFNGKLLIEISGANVSDGNGLFIVAQGTSTIQGLVINRFHAKVAGSPGSGNGILASSAANVQIFGNILGLDATGTIALGNDRGVFANSEGNTIGSTTQASRNIISGNTAEGIRLEAGFNTVQGNLIGTNLLGTGALANGTGVFAQTMSNSIGSLAPAGRNVISSNRVAGINVSDADGTKILGNFIGADISGTKNLGNGQTGIVVDTSVNTSIGGTMAGAGNVIAFNGGFPPPAMAGVLVLGGNGHSVLGNSIFSNSGLGIELAPNGVTANDTGDADTGPNKLQNNPEFSSATISNGSLTLSYSVLSALANATYPLRLEFFRTDSDGEEGEAFLGVDTYASADAGNSKTVTLGGSAVGALVVGDKVVGTATDANGNTSEFSAAVVIAAAPVVLHTPVVTGTTTYASTQSTQGLIIRPDPADTAVVKFFKVKGITNGTLFLPGGVTPIQENDFISVPDAVEGLRFTPAVGFVGTTSFSVQASTTNADAGLGGTPATVPINVIRPIVTISAPASAVNEDGGQTLTYTFTRDDATLGLTVNFNVLGTATFGLDYIPTPVGGVTPNVNAQAGTIDFGEGSNVATISFTPQSDNLVEGNEALGLLLIPSAVYGSGLDVPAVGTIQDADTATLAFESASLTALEGLAPKQVRVVLSMAPVNTLQNGASFVLVPSNGIAGDADYNSATIGQPITIPAGSGNGAVFAGSFAPTTDSLVEGDESLALGLSVTNGAVTIGQTSTQEVIIQDSDIAMFTINDVSVNEAAGTLDFSVSLSTAIDTDAQVDVSFTDNSTAAADFTHTSKSVNFLANSTTSQTVSVPINNDNIVEAIETFTAHLAINAATPLGGRNIVISDTGTGTIQDNDAAAFQIDDVVVNEEAGTLSFTVSLTNSIDIPVSVNVNYANVSTTAGDFDHTVGIAPFAALDTVNKTVTVPITNDNIVETIETFTAALSTATTLGGRNVSTSDTGTGTITDNDTATFTVVGGIAQEGSGSLAFTVSLSNPIDTVATLNISFTDSSTSAADFDHSLKQVTFPANSTAPQSIAVTMLDDSLIEGDETFSARLALNNATQLTGYGTNLAELGFATIRDNDRADIQIVSQGDQQVSETGGPQPVVIRLSTTGRLQNPLTIDVTAAPGANTEVNDANFGSLGSVTFPAGSGNGATVTISFTPLLDALVEGTEEATFQPTGPAFAELLSYIGGSVLIRDANLAKIEFVNTAQSVSESSPNPLAVLTRLNLTPGDSLENAVPGSVVVASLGTATANDFDSASFPKPFVFPAGSTNGATQTVTLAPQSDAVPQGNRTLTLGFAPAAADAPTRTATQQITIIDDDMAVAGFDFGDAPNSYGTLLSSDGARHLIGGPLFLGQSVDAEPDGRPNSAANADKDDGVTLPAVLMVGMQSAAQVVASAAGKLDAWIDFNRNGIFDAAERIATGLSVVKGTNTITFVVPPAAVSGASFARFRISTAGGLGPTGVASDGEVEDYATTIATQAADTAALIADPANPGKNILVMMGTAKNDDIQITLQKNGIILCKHGCRISTFTLAQVGRIVIFGGSGNDKLKVPTNLGLAFEIYGGAGDDTITGGSLADILDGGLGNDKITGGGGDDLVRGGGGNDMLDGGAGNDLLLGGDGVDQLLGGAGRDVLIGGIGADKLSGQQDDDLLIGGSTIYDNNDAALNDIVAQWRSADDFNTRIAKLSSLLNSATVLDDRAKDQLEAVGGRNWFLDFLNADTISKINLNPLSGDRKN